MKYLAFFVVFVLCVNLSQQLPELVNCTSDYKPPSSIADSCGVYTCDGINISGVGCPSYQCLPENYLGSKEQDNSKPYPECCGGPICGN